MAKRAKAENWLFFIDTNVLLDFYRLGGPSAERQLKALEQHKGVIIILDQVWAEFLRNRQKVIHEDAIKNLAKSPQRNAPPIVTDYQPFKMYRKATTESEKQLKKVRDKIEKVLRDPSKHDPVYQSLKRIFSNDSPYNLRRPDKRRFQIRSLARKRFSLGYPPRKANDTSIGDAVNWEWIIHCAQNCPNKSHVMIVTRDQDYGIMFDGAPILNDWLKHEFSERVGTRRKVELSNKLTEAIKKMNGSVTQTDVKEEKDLIGLYKSSRSFVEQPSQLTISPQLLRSTSDSEALRSMLASLLKSSRSDD
ncbi:DUF4935 domain-containing protein [Pyruvatibacter mobilis]|uniref:DUF4935 domain-containing protein n=1 Tax=Pyruvatibacter mobilis TaxID=1712261 RepID=A0A845QE25_9HYPH|nr:PIN domain-containing protein [Pyruvatibacter mobilis]NBG96697.1 DUF4935 domain-containing protein [Pyruvatibacter mobilis]QJD74306.1 DUF4935 domain-containing protein [Pyruvatibacter mobilis]